jgi:hypothetical protein
VRAHTRCVFSDEAVPGLLGAVIDEGDGLQQIHEREGFQLQILDVVLGGAEDRWRAAVALTFRLEFVCEAVDLRGSPTEDPQVVHDDG